MSKIKEKYFNFIAHYYRAEIYRETNWRNRLDVTTNWSIVVTAAILSYAFAETRVPHTVILVNFLLVWFFLYIESRRFRYFTMLRERTRILEHDLLAPIFIGKEPTLKTAKNWGNDMNNILIHPKTHMSKIEAVSWRMKRNYIMLFVFLYLVWLTKIRVSPVNVGTFPEIINNAQLSIIPGWFVFTSFTLFLLVSMALAVYVPRKSHGDDLP